jgi:hypothetical protein
MRRLKNARTRVVINVDEATAASLRDSHEWRDPEALAAEELSGNDASRAAGVDYGKSNVKALRKMIADRNSGREPEAQVSDKGNKAALVAALVADDEALAEDDEDEDDDSVGDTPPPVGSQSSPFSS